MADVVVGLAELLLSREPPAEVGELWSCVLGIVETLISSGSGWLILTLTGVVRFIRFSFETRYCWFVSNILITAFSP